MSIKGLPFQYENSKNFEELKDRILEKQSNDIIENIDVVGGYLNFVINKNIIIKEYRVVAANII